MGWRGTAVAQGRAYDGTSSRVLGEIDDRLEHKAGTVRAQSTAVLGSSQGGTWAGQLTARGRPSR